MELTHCPTLSDGFGMELTHCPAFSDGFGIGRHEWCFGGTRQFHSIGFVSYYYAILGELCTLELQSVSLERELTEREKPSASVADFNSLLRD
jgi:hypothetical protein